MKYCGECGKQAEEDAEICPGCRHVPTLNRQRLGEVARRFRAHPRHPLHILGRVYYV